MIIGLTGRHADLNQHMMKFMSDPICPLCQEEEETALHLLGRCSALSLTRLTLLGLYLIDNTDLPVDNICSLYSRSLSKL